MIKPKMMHRATIGSTDVGKKDYKRLKESRKATIRAVL
jgi:hypothetical protein